MLAATKIPIWRFRLQTAKLLNDVVTTEMTLFTLSWTLEQQIYTGCSKSFTVQTNTKTNGSNQCTKDSFSSFSSQKVFQWGTMMVTLKVWFTFSNCLAWSALFTTKHIISRFTLPNIINQLAFSHWFFHNWDTLGWWHISDVYKSGVCMHRQGRA